ncbi:MAG: hypothetical protein EOO73_31290 [Myxococcales bacterium]|nr:MAG: hypothetical protein EOO73_31290 [Myxococcales bacterium]
MLVVGLFVGGRGRRLGGVAKGLLPAPGSAQTLLERLVGEARAALGEAELVLVGDAAAYSASGLTAVDDAPRGVGPLGGLGGLLHHAQQRGATHVLALACDLPYVSAPLLARLATEAPGAAALAAHGGGLRNPLVARYEVARALPAVQSALASKKHALQAVLDALGAELLTMTEEETRSLHDWDTPEDVAR